MNKENMVQYGIYSEEYYSALKNERNPVICSIAEPRRFEAK
jgi:hypothetical protein